MISQTAEYALRAIVYLGNENEGSPCTISHLAPAIDAPESYLSKVMQRLSREGIVASQRGLHGGFVLAREASDLSVFDIVDAVDPIQRIHHCPLGNEDHSEKLCPLHTLMDATLGQAEDQFRKVTVATLLEKPAQKKCSQTCQFPCSQSEKCDH